MANSQQNNTDSVRVAVRCRPLSEDEETAKYKSVVVVDQLRGQITVHVPNARTKEERERSFNFDSVFGTDAKQTDIYNETSRPIVDAVLEGYNGTIFAYGQTGTGKTFTMAGLKDVPESRGIIPNSFAHIFGHIAKCGEGVQFLVRVSYLEIYKEEVRDLLSKNHAARLEVRERVDVGVYVKDLTSFVVKNPEEMDKLMFIGDKNRMVGPTDMNEHSSRSHTIFTITVERSDEGPDHQQHLRMGKLHLVDLAGSERQTKTKATGDRLKEAIQINLSLSTLGNVISALVDGKSTHIPYRNSKLTRLLQDSLGGNSKTIMIANVGPADYNCDETLNTLRYASRAKNIQNKAHINEDPKDAMLREFQKEIEELRKKLEEDDNGEEPQEGGAKDQSGKRSGGSGLTPQQAAALRAKIEQERLELLNKKDLAQSERDKAQQELERRENDIKKAQEQHEALEQKLAALQNKVIVGGVNLLEKAEEQERLLEESERKLEKRRKREEELRQQLQQKEAERQDIEGKYTSLQEEAAAKTAKLKEIWKQFQAAKEELADMKAEFQRENEDTLESIRQTSRELKLQLMTINHFIPKECQDLLDAHVVWHEDTGEWHVQGVAYAGNNMKRQPTPEPTPEHSNTQQFNWSDTSSAYLIYHIGSQEVHSLAPSTSESGVSARSSKGLRKPSTEKAKVSQRKLAGDAKVQPVAEGDQEYPTSRGLISRQKHFA